MIRTDHISKRNAPRTAIVICIEHQNAPSFIVITFFDVLTNSRREAVKQDYEQWITYYVIDIKGKLKCNTREVINTNRVITSKCYSQLGIIDFHIPIYI